MKRSSKPAQAIQAAASGSRAVENHGLVIRYALRAFTRVLTLVAADLEVSAPQYRILRTLGQKTGLTQVELAKETAMDRPFVSLTIKQLREAGFVKTTRSPVDKRRVDVHLTAKGSNLLSTLLARLKRSDEIAGDDISVSDLKTMHAVLKKMTDNVERYCDDLERATKRD